MTETEMALTQYEHMRESSTIFSYCGSINHDLMASLLQLSDTKLQELNAPTRKKKNIINILIECLQNVINHADEDADATGKKSCVISFGKDPEQFFIIAGNPISRASAEKLTNKLANMVDLSAEQLHTLYLDQLATGNLSDKGGAGLGIMRILRESGQQFAYSISAIDERFSFFSFKVKIAA